MLKKMTQWYNHEKHARYMHVGVFALAVAGVFLFVNATSAYFMEDTVNSIITSIVQTIVHFLGNILLLFIQILIGVFKYSDFINTPAVQLGWVIIRDIANIGVVIALMIIAFATVFNIKQYSASQLLVRLVIAAVLINFSRLISGLIIDVGQVFMGTFVHAFKDLAAGNLTVGFGIEDMLAVATGPQSRDITASAVDSSVISSILLAIVMLIVAIGAVMAFIAVLLQRIVYLWILVIFAPVAYIAPLLPGGSKWSGQWWSNFSKQVIIGPTLAFGFWLSMSILSGLSSEQHLIRLKSDAIDDSQFTEQTNENSVAYFASKVSTPQAVFDYMVVIALLMGTLWMAQQAGGAAGKFAGQIEGKLKSAGSKAVKAPFGALATVTGAKYATDVYKSYKDKRKSIRSGNISDRAAQVSAFRDDKIFSMENRTQAGKERVRARVKQEKIDRMAREMNNADVLYDIYDANGDGLRDIYDGKGKAGKSIAAQRKAATYMQKKRNGFGTGKEGGARIEQLKDKFDNVTKYVGPAEDDIKVNSTDAATHSYIYYNIADENATEEQLKLGSKKIADDMADDVVSTSVLNKQPTFNNIEKGLRMHGERDENGELKTIEHKSIDKKTGEEITEVEYVGDGNNIGKRLAQNARDGNHLSKLYSNLNDKTRESIAEANKFGVGNLDQDKRVKLGEDGMLRFAFKGQDKLFEETLESVSFRNKMFQNMVRDEYKDGENMIHLSRHAPTPELENAMKNGDDRIAMIEGFKNARDLYEGANDQYVLNQNDEKDETLKKIRRGLVKSSRDIREGYKTAFDRDPVKAREMVMEELTSGELSGGNIRSTFGTNPDGTLKIDDQELFDDLVLNMTIAQHSDLATRKKGVMERAIIKRVGEFAESHADEEVRRQMQSTYQALIKNMNTARLTPKKDFNESSKGGPKGKGKSKKKAP